MIRSALESERTRSIARKTRRAYSWASLAVMVPLILHGLWSLFQWIAF
jgi:hypothetical protein